MKRERHLWDDERFISRCREAAARKGWSVEELCEAAGYDRYFLNKPAPVGRRIDGIMALANTADVTIDWLLGIDKKPASSSSELARLAAVTTVAAHLYVALSTQQSDMDADAIVRSVLRVIGDKAKPAGSGDAPTPMPNAVVAKHK